jgi:2-polyprenyl-3-methyl-5-hydroxy-6-metoxy-1,4-benzoquinol methylase
MSLENVNICPVCGGKTFTPHLSCKDYTTTEEMFHVERCTTCGLLITNPRPLEHLAADYYQSSKYISHTAVATGLIDYIYLTVRQFTLRWKYSLIKAKLKNNKLLDFGCGTGAFLNYCIKKGVNAHGVEPSLTARASQSKIHGSIDQIQTKDFDVITLWHVLEHVYSLDQTLDQLREKLSNTGTIFIAVPNWQSDDAKHYGAGWAAYDVPRHLWHFSKETMKALLEKKGFKLQTILPMKLDAYYVSILSEKNATDGSLSFSKIARAIRIAFTSNARAKQQLNYSSLIYVATK